MDLLQNLRLISMAIFLGGLRGVRKAATGREKRMPNIGGKIFNLYHFFTVIDICSGPVNEKDAALS